MNPEILIRKTLQSYPLGNMVSFEALTQGFANDNYKIVTGRGTFLFRIHRVQTMEDIRKEHLMLRMLKSIDFPAAYPVPDKTGKMLLVVDDLPVSLYDFVAGKTPKLNSETVAEAASALALLHTINSAGIPQKQNSIRPEKVACLMKRFSAASNPLPDIFELFTRLWKQLEPFLHQQLPTGLIHGDLFPDNTIFEGKKLKAIIDFEQFSTDQLLFDVAMCSNGFCFTDNRLNPLMLEVFLYAYNQKRPLEDTEKELLPRYIQWTALGMASWHLQYHLIYKPDPRQEKRVRELLDRVSYLSTATL